MAMRKEVRHISYLGLRGDNDIHLVKEQHYHDDGTVTPHLQLVHNFEIPFWVTKKNNQTYEQKKEREPFHRVAKHMSRQCDLERTIGTALGMRGKRMNVLSQSPYLYGGNIPSEAHLKEAYTTKYGPATGSYSLAAFDLEVDVVRGTGEILASSIAFKKEVEVYILRDFIPETCDDVVMDLLAKSKNKYLQHILKAGATVKFILCETEADVITQSIARLHEWKPDVVSVWNIKYDLPIVEKRSQALGIDIKQLWSDPCIPRPLQRYYFKEGRSSSMTEDGQFKKIQFEDRWHTIYTSSSFVLLDGMCTYRRLRTQQARLPSYSLDSILKREKLPEKVKIEGCDQYKGLALHVHQQSKRQVEYSAYAAGDSWALLDLDAKILDLELTLPLFQGDSPFSLAATPSRQADINLFFWLLRNEGHVLGTAAYLDKDDPEAVKKDRMLNKHLSTRNIIVTVDAWKTTMNGSKCLIEDPNRITNIRKFGSDDDVESSYPSCYSAGNICKETCVNEIINVTGTRSNNFIAANFNSLSGRVNSLQVGIELFGLPTPEETLKLVASL